MSASASSAMPSALPLVFQALDERQLAMLRRGVPTMVASADTALRPSVALATGCLFDAQAGEITVYLHRSAARQVLADVADGGRIAVMCVEPRSHRAVQFKSGVVKRRDAGAADRHALARYAASMEKELFDVGHSRTFVNVLTGWQEADLVALSFVPEQVFDQAPGPQAGAPLTAAAPDDHG